MENVRKYEMMRMDAKLRSGTVIEHYKRFKGNDYKKSK
jgi:hypothetical protein